MMSALIRQSRHLVLPLGLTLLTAFLLAMRPVPTSLEQVLSRGELVVASRFSPTTWYQDQHGDTGLEYELAKAFAEELGVSLRMVSADNIPDLINMVRRGKVDLAAAALAITPDRKDTLRFAGDYQTVSERIIYRAGDIRPTSLGDISNRRIAVLAGSSQEEELRDLRRHGMDIQFGSIEATNTERLLSLLTEGSYDLALVDSNSWQLHRALFPELRAGLDIADQQLGWAFRKQADNSLHLAAQRFLTQRKADGSIARLESRFYGQAEQMNLYSSRSFLRHLDARLPQYAEAFRQAAEDQGFDWRLLAALGYQESMWDQHAVSPTGVRGLMMLTQRTAAEMGVADRTDPIASIHAGAAYLRKLYDRMPDRIPEPDRTWFAVAAYNVGFGHVEDARVLTQRHGGNPDVWADVQKNLPLLRQEAYYRHARHGYARGGMQAVIYVRHIRHYYDLLVWANDSNRFGANMVAMAD